MRFGRIFTLVLLLSGSMQATTITFEGVPDSTTVRDLYSGLGLGITFVRATVITAGVSLNELEFPPHSGVNVAFDDSGNILADFSVPVNSISGYFTYLKPITLVTYDAAGHVLGSKTSQFGDNTLLDGDPGSSPNESIQFGSITPIASISVTGDPNGSSFVMDDFSFGPSSQTPEPSTASLIVGAVLGLTIAGLRKQGGGSNAAC